jgi:hypothetical protein
MVSLDDEMMDRATSMMKRAQSQIDLEGGVINTIGVLLRQGRERSTKSHEFRSAQNILVRNFRVNSWIFFAGVNSRVTRTLNGWLD